MKSRVIITSGVTLNYKPTYPGLSFSAGTADEFVNFYWVPEKSQFEINQNPHGEASLKPIRQIEVHSSQISVVFQCSYQHKETQFTLNTAYPCDQQTVRLLTDLPVQGLPVEQATYDSLQFTTEGGYLTRLQLDRNQSSEAGEQSLIVLGHENTLIWRRIDPWGRISISSMTIVDDEINIVTDQQIVRWTIRLPAVLQHLLRSLFITGLPDHLV